MEKVRPWCGQPSDRGRLKNRTEYVTIIIVVVVVVVVVVHIASLHFIYPAVRNTNALYTMQLTAVWEDAAMHEVH